MGHSFSWNGGSGDWSLQWWTDLTSPPGLLAPGLADTVTFPAWPNSETVGGTGEAAQILVQTAITLDGQFIASSVLNAATIAFLPAATLTATSGQGGAYVVTGAGATLVFGTLTAPGAITLADHGSLLAGSIDLGNAAISVDDTARMEIGVVGDEPDGMFRVDPGLDAKGAGFAISGNIQNNGTIETTASAALSGTIGSASGGVLLIDAGATLALAGTVNAGNTADFAGAAGVLDLRNAALNGLTLQDFAAGDTILLPSGITTALFTANAGQPYGGQLTLSASGTVVEVLDLAGDYAGTTFSLLQGNGGVALTNSAPPSRTLLWQGGTATLWHSAADWADLTSGSTLAAAAPPGGNDRVSIIGGSDSAATITDIGTARSLTISGYVTLDANVTVDTLNVLPLIATGGHANILIPEQMVSSGTIVTASATLTSVLDVAGPNSGFDVAGTLSMQEITTLPLTNTRSYTGQLSLTAHATAVVGGLDMEPIPEAPSIAPSITIDSTSALEVGSGGTLVAGAISVDAGKTIDLAGSLSTNIFNSGVARIHGGPTQPVRIIGGVIGPGTIDASDTGAGNGLEFTSLVGVGSTILMGGSNDVVTIDTPSLFGGSITGLDSGGTISLPGSITSASVAANGLGLEAGDVVTLFAGDTSVGTIALSGNYNGRIVHFNTGTAQATLTVSVAPSLGDTLALYPWTDGPYAWNSASTWTDQANGGVPNMGPNASNPVYLTPFAPRDTTLTGGGISASLEVRGPYELSGSYQTGMLQIDAGGALDYHFWPVYAWLVVTEGSTLTATGASISNALTVSGAGASLDVTGATQLLVGYDYSGMIPITPTGTLNVADGGSARLDSLSLAAGTFVKLDSTSTLEIGSTGGARPGVVTVDAGRTISGSGEITAGMTNNGTLVANDGDTLQIDGAISGDGLVYVGDGGTMRLLGGIGADQGVLMGSNGSTLDIGSAAGSVVLNFSGSDVIALEQSPDTLTYTQEPFGQGQLAWSQQGTLEGWLTLAGSFLQRDFVLTTGPTSTISFAAACFASGTRIRTRRGEVAVEALVVGDVTINPWGEHLPVTWIGHRHVVTDRHPRPWDVQPVRVVAGAFGPGRPVRDLVLSPDHAVFLDGLLIPIRHLVNGATIRQEAVASVTYWHVELERHDVLLAEGMTCESYLDTGNRGAFANGGGAVALHPDFARGVWESQACGTLVTEGAALVAARRAVLARAEALGHSLSAEPALEVIVDGRVVRPLISGRRWAVAAGGVVRLRSRAWVPAHVRPEEADTRRLGVAIGNPRLDGVALPLDDPRFGAGWAAVEEGWRWTTGDGAIDLAGGQAFTFDLMMTGTYWCDEMDEIGLLLNNRNK